MEGAKKADGIELFFLNSLDKEVKKVTPFKISHSYPEAYTVQKEFESTNQAESSLTQKSRERIKKLSTVD